MSKVGLIGLLGFSVGLSSCTLNASPPPSSLPVTRAAPQTLQSEVHSLPQAIVHTLRIPAASNYTVTLAVADTVESVSAMARRTGAIAAINAGFFDPVNQQTTSYIVRNGKLVADPQQNDRLMGNPNLTRYLEQILNRSEFRRYRCDTATRYDITPHRQPMPPGCQLIDAMGAGPQLLPQNTAVAEGFVDEATGRDALGSTQPNARSAIGITATGDVIWMLVAQKPDAPNTSGMTFAEMATFLRAQGVEKALNLDGGSSSALYSALADNGESRFAKVDRTGAPVQRSIKSVLLVLP